MRFALIALTISCISIGFTAQATETPQLKKTVESLELELSSKQAEYDTFITSLADLNKQLEVEAATLSNARKQGDNLVSLRKDALANMNKQYEMLIDNPEQDMLPAQTAYRKAVMNQKQNKQEIQSAVATVEKLKSELGQRNIARFTLVNSREALQEEIKIARVKRLRQEFETRQEVKVQQVVNCDPEETFVKCIKRSERLSKQKASKTFLKMLYSSATESNVISKNKTNSAARIKLLKHKIVTSEFSGRGTYSSTMAVQLQGSLPNYEACSLLNMSKRYCSYDHKQQAVFVPTPTAQINDGEEGLLYELTVRSDQFDDEVFIDGVSYGSTRLSVMLSAGEHDVVIKKPNYISYEEKIGLNKNTLLKAKLAKSTAAPANGEKIQDLILGGELGPELIGIPAGSFQMGDLKGSGLSNEKPARNAVIDRSFSMAQNQTTIADFRHFVMQSKYVTEAEAGQGCATFVDGQPTYDATLNWRNPGFKQSDLHPVVCLSKKDTQAYLKWLSKVTERKYRLPTEIEWEYVARADSSDNFWWGNDIGNNKANCAYCGSEWSNKSTSPVKSFSANNFGIFDTVGNVWELTEGDNVVARGGSWNFAPTLARAAVRLELSPNFRSNYLGFRVLREN
ncbi:MAG: sulfatase activating formylglycine-generating enzyme [Moritella sp.]|jgi:formylglycine-generating enzyme required for sulfatase activity